MTAPFETTHRVYDLIYRDKDYAAEAAQLAFLLRAHAPGATDLLELGCGSGRHALCLSELGYHVTGVDRSQGMLELARARTAERENDRAVDRAGPQFAQADIRRLHLGQSFDAVVSLFHVMSYITTDADLDRVLRGVHQHLRPGGAFLFDFWYGPGVLTQRPTARSTQLASESLACTRSVRPVMHANRNVTDVHITVQGRRLPDGEDFSFTEKHSMRYFFLPELASHAQAAGLKVAAFLPTRGRRLGFSSWHALAVLRRPPEAGQPTGQTTRLSLGQKTGQQTGQGKDRKAGA